MPLITERRSFTQQLEVITGGTCDGCGGDLNLPDHIVNHPVRTSLGSLEVSGGLHFTVGAGYFSYYDGKDIELLFCKECVLKLVAMFPGIDAAIKKAEQQ